MMEERDGERLAMERGGRVWLEVGAAVLQVFGDTEKQPGSPPVTLRYRRGKK